MFSTYFYCQVKSKVKTNILCYLQLIFSLTLFSGVCCMGNGRGYRFRVVAEFGTCPGMRLCHHPHVIGQYPDMYDGAALRRTHFGKPSILCIRVSTFVEFWAQRASIGCQRPPYTWSKYRAPKVSLYLLFGFASLSSPTCYWPISRYVLWWCCSSCNALILVCHQYCALGYLVLGLVTLYVL